MNSWPLTSLKGKVSIKHGFPFKSEFFSDDRTEFIVLTPGNFYEEGGFKRQAGKEKYYNGEIPLEYLHEADDLIVAMTEQAVGLLGSCARVPESGVYLHNQRLGLITTDSKKILKDYVYHLFKTKTVREQIQHTSSGSKVKHTSPERIYEVIVPLPNVPQQQKIVDLLDAIEEKINLNTQINIELESMAKTLYDYWFVQFDFPNADGKPYKASGGKMIYNKALNREIPDGWEVVPIDYFADVIDPHPSHRAPKEVEIGFPFAGIGDVDEAGNISLSKARQIDEEFVLKQEKDYYIGDYSLGYGRVGTVGKVVRLKKQKFRYALSPTLSVINPKKSEYAGYVYTAIKSEEFYKHALKNASGTTRPAIGIQLLRKIPVLKPGLEHNAMFEHYENVTKEMFEKTNVINKESQLLIELRDWLLPMLMNGQITVK